MRTIFKTAVLSIFITAMAASARPQDGNAKTLSGILNETEITGAWQINSAKSDDPLEKMRTMPEGRMPLANEKTTNETNNLPTVSVSLVPPQTLVIAKGDEKNITINEGYNEIVFTKTFAADGVMRTAEIQSGANLSMTAELIADSLKIETVSPRKNRMLESYTLADQGKKLIVTVRFEDSAAKEIITFRRVYDRIVSELFITEPNDFQ